MSIESEWENPNVFVTTRNANKSRWGQACVFIPCFTQVHVVAYKSTKMDSMTHLAKCSPQCVNPTRTHTHSHLFINSFIRSLSYLFINSFINPLNPMKSPCLPTLYPCPSAIGAFLSGTPMAWWRRCCPTTPRKLRRTRCGSATRTASGRNGWDPKSSATPCSACRAGS